MRSSLATRCRRPGHSSRPVVELLEELGAIEVAVGHLVEVLLDAAGEAEFDELPEVILQQPRDGKGGIARDERLALAPT